MGRCRRHPIGHHRSTSSRTTRTARRPAQLEKTFAGSQGTVRLDYDGQSITDPALADQVLAELTGIPTEAFFRSTASVRHSRAERPRPRRGRPARPAPGVDQRRRPRHEPGQAQARQARSTTSRPRATRTPAGSRSPRPRSPGRRGPRAGRAGPGPARAGPRHPRGRAGAAGHAEGALAERRGMLEKARQAERLASERDAAQDRYERFRRAVEVDGQVAVLAASHPSAEPAAGRPVRRRASAHARPEGARAPGGAVRRDRGLLRGRGRAQLAAAVALGHRADDHRRAHRGRHDRGGPPRRSRPSGASRA